MPVVSIRLKLQATGLYLSMIKLLQILTILLFSFCFLSISFGWNINAQESDLSPGRIENYAEGRIVDIEEETIEIQGIEYLRQTITVEAEVNGELEELEIVNQAPIGGMEIDYDKGDKVIVDQVTTSDGQVLYYITDFIRFNSLYLLVGIFVVLTVVIARKKGLLSIIGLIFSFIIMLKFMLPQIREGWHPLLVAILSAIVIIPFNFYISHGFSRKTTFAVISTIITLAITGLIAIYFVDASNLTGFTSDEASFLSILSEGKINIRDLLLAGIIIGILGILDDITISQSSVAYQLKSASPAMEFKELFTRTMEVGRDHIASLVNTLILVYTSAALPLLILFLDSTDSFSKTVNREIVAEEVIRTGVTSIGLILAVPISTFIAAYFFSRSDVNKLILNSAEDIQNHNHHGHTH